MSISNYMQILSALLLVMTLAACSAAPVVEESAVVDPAMPEQEAAQEATIVPAEVQESVVMQPAESVVVQPESISIVEPAKSKFKPADVIWIQERLQELGYYDGSIDGSVGRATRRAIEAYQVDQGLEANGMPDADLREFMWRNGG